MEKRSFEHFTNACSYDTWHGNIAYDGETSEDFDKPTLFKVDANWLIDSVTYNEWMNEYDYLLPIPDVMEAAPAFYTLKEFMEKCEEDKDTKKKGGRKRKRSASPAEATSKKR